MKKYYLAILSIILLANCATYKTKYAEGFGNQDMPTAKTISHTVYLIGDAGKSPKDDLNNVLKVFKEKLATADANSTAIFLGDNIYPAGLPSETDTANYKAAKSQLDAQLATLENFKGRPLFIPGNHDWYSDGLEGVARQEKYIKERLKEKKPFLPENGCPIEEINIGDAIAIIVVDTEWYLTNWNKHPTMNEHCDIKSREKFWVEVESLIQKNRNKTTLIAMHHPLYSYGPHGGQFSMKKQLFPASKKLPLPVLGSFISVLRKTSGGSPADVQNKRYADFKNRMITLAQDSKKVIFTSGHEHTLQYIIENNIPQIVSGSGAKKGASRLLNGSQFSTGRTGYAVLEIYTDGASSVRFYGIKNKTKEEFLFKTDVFLADEKQGVVDSENSSKSEIIVPQNLDKAHYEITNGYAVVTGTAKEDWFEIEYLNAEKTAVSVYQISEGEKKERYFHKIFKKEDAKEIWVYGLDNKDRFVVTGDNRNSIKVRLIGGQDNDIYNVTEGKGTYIYDHKTKKNTFKAISKAKLRLTDNYNVNTYQPLKIRNNSNLLIPNIGYNPDHGFNIGINETYTHEGFRTNPFTQQHKLNAAFHFATSGFEIGYTGEFANVLGKANLELAAKVTSPNFSVNFFGFGNETENLDDINALELDFNRVGLETLKFAPSLVWRGALGSKLRAGISYEYIEVKNEEDRFINTFFQTNENNTINRFVGVDGQYTYKNTDNSTFSTMAMAVSLHSGYKVATTGDGNFGYVIPLISFDYKLVPSGRLVLATKFKAHFNIGDDFEFYQGASIGGLDGLRGYRNERFTGKKSYYQNSDIRYNFSKIGIGTTPTAFGFYGGFDYGRVWLPNQDSNVWNTSYGGGLFLNVADIISFKTGLFNSSDGNRFSFGLSYGF